MYCSACGIAVAESLSYCNHCGARIVAANTDKVGTSSDNIAASSTIKPELLISAMLMTFVFGLLAIAVLLRVLKSMLGLNVGQILAFACLSFLIMIVLESVFLLLLLRRDRPVEKRSTSELPAGHTTKELGVPQMQALREPPSSVTDHTTRAFEPIYTKQNKTT